ncbi:hypothetical protein CC2G_014496 [Coprinopsis cinerea AmutBmut pab1-1]|nr:hypothetical protein CC2G_014496 [Coprinopsis cinerea AmutBmut pab1-1]
MRTTLVRYAVIPIVAFLASFTVSIPSIIPLFQRSYSNYVLLSIDSFLYLVLHLIVTALIVFKIVRTRRALQKALGEYADKDKVYTGVTSILVESAAAIAFFSAGYAILNVVYLTGRNTSWAAYQTLIVFGIGYGVVVSCNWAIVG